MFSVITNIYNKKTNGPTLMELFTATGKPKKFFFLHLEMFDLCTRGDTAHIDMIFEFFRRVTLMVHIGMWVFRSPYSDTATIYCNADIECRFVTELHLFQEMIIGTH